MTTDHVEAGPLPTQPVYRTAVPIFDPMHSFRAFRERHFSKLSFLQGEFFFVFEFYSIG